MRTMLRISMPVEAGNRAVTEGTLALTFQSLAERLRPEAAYFFPEDGRRTALFVFDMQEASQIPAIVEPLFMGLQAAVTLTPVMNAEDLRKGLADAAGRR